MNNRAVIWASNRRVQMAKKHSELTGADLHNPKGIGSENTSTALIVSQSTQTISVSGSVIPNATNTYDLGTSAKMWKDIYVSSGSIKFVDPSTNLVVSTIGLDADGNQNISGSVLPDADATYDLGSSTKEWNNLYIDGTANIDSLTLTSGATVTAVLDEDGMGTNSATSLSTQQSIKAYVDAQVTAQDLDFQGDSGGALSIDLDSETLDIAGDGAGISTAGSSNQITISGDHDALTNFVANEHIDHSGVTLTAGTGLSGGGTIAASRTFTVDLNELTTETSIADADFIAMVDATDDGSGKITFENLEDAIFASVSGDVLITEAGVSSIQANSVALTTDTTGHYVATITGGTGITSTAATTGEGTTHSLSVDASQTQITSVGTIGTGVWEGTTVAVDQGGTGVTTKTGTGNVVLSSSPTLVTPALGTPSALVGTNISGTASNLTAGLVTNGVYTTNNLSVMAATTSAQLRGVLSDETGTGVAVFATSPTLVTPALGTPASGVMTNVTGTASGLTSGKTTVTDSTANTNFPIALHDESNALLDDTGTFTYNPSTSTLVVPNINVSGTQTFVDTATLVVTSSIVFEGATDDGYETTLTVVDPTNDRTWTLQNATDTIVGLATSDTLTNKTLTSPTITGTGAIAGTFTGDITGDVTGNADTSTKIASITNSNIVQLTSSQTLTNKTLTSPTLTGPVLGTPASGTMTNVNGTSGITGLGTQSQDLEMGGQNIQTAGVITLKEQADADADVAGEGQIWVDTATPNVLYFTNDAGTDHRLNFSTSAHLRGMLSDETGTGGAVFATSPTIVTPTIASFANATHTHANAAGGGQITLGTGTTGNYVATAVAGDGIDVSGATGNVTITAEDSTAGNKGIVIVAGGTNATVGYSSGTATVNVDDAFLKNDASDTTSGTITAGGFTTTATGSIAYVKASDEISGSISQAIQAGITTAANLTTVGTIGSGTWEGTTVAVAQGGTGVTSKTGTGNVVLSSSPTLVTPALGTPASGVATNITGLPISSGVSGLASGVATFLGTPSSANLRSAVTDETGTGGLVFATSPTLTTPALGTPSALVGTNISGTASSLSIGGTAALATDVTITANNSTDESVYPVFVDGATGTQGLESDTGLSYNPNTGVLTVGSIVGALEGSATQITVTAVTDDDTVFPVFTTTSSGTNAPEVATGLNYNPSSGLLTTTTVAAALTGNASTATKIASITNSNIVQLTETQTLTNKTLTSPTLTTPALGTPSALVLTNATALPAAQVSQGTMASGMVLVAPALGTPASGVMTNVTGTASSLTAGKTTVTDSTANTDFPIVLHNESNALLDDTGTFTYNPSTGKMKVGSIDVSGTISTVNTATMVVTSSITFEGATSDAHEVTLGTVDPTADSTINLPNMSAGTYYLPVLSSASTTAISTTPTKLNYLTSAGGTTGTTSTNIVFSTSPTLVTPALGTPSALVLTNATALPAAQVSQGTMASGMVLVAPALGTPASGVMTNVTGTAAGLTVGATTGVEAGADVTDTANVTSAGAVMDSEVTNLAFVKALAKGISDGNVLTANDAVADNDYLQINGTEAEGRTYAEVRSDLGLGNIYAKDAGISDGNVLTANDVVADNDFLRISGTEVEGLTVAEVLSALSVESGADVTDTTNVTAAGALMDSELTTIALVKGLAAGISDGNVLTANDAVADNDYLQINGTEVEGRTYTEVRSDLGIEAGATADQSNAEIVAAVEAGTDSNTFTDADHTKLNAIEASADVTDTTNVTSAGALMDSEVDADIKTLSLPASTTISTFGASLIDDAAASNSRTTLGLGTSAVLSTAAIANGGTGVATADQIHTFVTTQTDEMDAGTSGNAATATLASTITITDNESTNELNAILFSAGADADGGSLGVEQDHSGLTYNPSTGGVTATLFTGAVTGEVTGNAATATKIASITNSNIVQLTSSQTLTNKTLTSPTLTTPALGTPSALVLTNATALPAAQVAQGTMASGMVLVAPALGTPASGVLTNCTALPAAQVSQGTMASGMVLVAPALGTPASGVMTNVTGTASSLTAGNATLAATVTVADSTANTNFPIVFNNESNTLFDDTGAFTYNPSTGKLKVANIDVSGTQTFVNTAALVVTSSVIFEGATSDDFETTLTVTDPTADRTITLKNADGTVAFTSDITGTNSNTNTGDQLVFKNVASDSGTAVADTTTDTLTIAGGTGITTAVSGDTVTITGHAVYTDAEAVSAVSSADDYLKNDANDTTSGNLTVGGLTIGGHSVDDIDITSEASNADDHLMTALAIKNRIEDYNYSTTTGTVTNVATAGTVSGLTLTGGAITSTGTITLGGTLTLGNLDTGGNAATATTAGISTTSTVADTTDTSCYVGLWESATGNLGAKSDAGLTYNAGTGMLTATGFTGPLTGQAATVATIAGLAPNTATTQATQGAITSAANLVTVGTIGTGVWNGDKVASAYLDDDTAHLTTTQTFSGAKTFSSLASFTMDGNTITGVDDSGEFTDDDAHIMTSAAVQDKILGYGYSTTVGDITGVTAGTGMSGGGASGAVTLTNAGVTSNVAGSGISVSGATGAVTVANTGVTSIVAGTGIDVSGATGAVTVSTEQDIDTGANVTFNDFRADSIGVGMAATSTTGQLDAAADIIAFSSSDKRWKENLIRISDPLEKIGKISGYEFDWKELTEEERKTQHSQTGHDIGVIAQEIQEVLPEVVKERDNGYLAVKYEKIVPLLIEAIKEQQKQIDELRKSKMNKRIRE